MYINSTGYVLLSIYLILILSNLNCSSALLRPTLHSGKSLITQHMIGPISQDILSSTAALGGSALWLKLWIELANSNKIDPRLSRKIIHCGSAPLFICLWPLYSSSGLSSRLIAASIPLVQMTRLILAGTRVESADKDQSASIDGIINAISRSGSKSEALGGPLIYTIVLLLGTFLFFRDSPIGVVAICQMAAGDGIADIVGRRWGDLKWPFSEKKRLGLGLGLGTL
jgi:phytol kinase